MTPPPCDTTEGVIWLAILALVAPIHVLRRRVVDRLAEGGDPSEAGLAVLECQRTVREHLSLAERRMAITIDSTKTPPLTQILDRIAAVTGVPVGE